MRGSDEKCAPSLKPAVAIGQQIVELIKLRTAPETGREDQKQLDHKLDRLMDKFIDSLD